MIRHSLLLFAALSFLVLPVAHAQSAIVVAWCATTGASVAGATVTATSKQAWNVPPSRTRRVGLALPATVGQYRATRDGFGLSVPSCRKASRWM